MDLSDNAVELIGHLAWPATALIAGVLFYRPIATLLETLGRRMSKLSILQMTIDLGALSQARALGATIEKLRSVPVDESRVENIAQGALGSNSADYVIIVLGADDSESWLTSRLFLLSAMLERSRAARCIVFLGDEERYLGAASPRDVRILLGTHYLVYEAAFASAYGPLGGLDPGIFKGGLSEPLVNGISNKFLTDSRIVVRAPPAKAIDWVHLERKPPDPSTWEFADWVTAGRLSDILGIHLSIGSAVGGAGAAGAETVKSIIAQRGPFVALVSPTGRFQALCDRAIVLESVARQAAE